MIVETCAFETDRLIVKPWHADPDGDWPQLNLVAVIAGMLTEPVTRHLPRSWQGSYSLDRARAWIDERDGESSILLAIGRQSQEPVGLVILVELQNATRGLSDIRLGYLLAETSWGMGLASELLRGLTGWCRDQSSIGWITGGVAATNEPSKRVLERLGFSPIAGNSGLGDELLYQLELFDR